MVSITVFASTKYANRANFTPKRCEHETRRYNERIRLCRAPRAPRWTDSVFRHFALSILGFISGRAIGSFAVEIRALIRRVDPTKANVFARSARFAVASSRTHPGQDRRLGKIERLLAKTVARCHRTSGGQPDCPVMDILNPAPQMIPFEVNFRKRAIF